MSLFQDAASEQHVRLVAGEAWAIGRTLHDFVDGGAVLGGFLMCMARYVASTDSITVKLDASDRAMVERGRAAMLAAI